MAKYTVKSFSWSADNPQYVCYRTEGCGTTIPEAIDDALEFLAQSPDFDDCENWDEIENGLIEGLTETERSSDIYSYLGIDEEEAIDDCECLFYVSLEIEKSE